MKYAVKAIATLVVFGCVAACNNNTATQSSPAAPGAAPAPSPGHFANQSPPPPVVPLNKEQAVYIVNSVVLGHPADAPSAIAVRVRGVVRTEGWTVPKLVEVPGIDGRTDIRNYKFVAMSPATAPTRWRTSRIDTEVRLDSLPPDVKAIRVVSETNEVSATIPH